MPPLRVRQREQVRHELTAAAIRLFDARGYHETPLADIAAAAGVSERTLFRHVGDKEDLLFGDDGPALELLTRTVREAPDDMPPLQVALRAGLAVIAALPRDLDLEARDRVIAATPALRAREAAKDRAYADAVRDALVAHRGQDATSAGILAGVSTALVRQLYIELGTAAPAAEDRLREYLAILRRSIS